MHHRPLRRAAALSLGALLAFAGTAAADTVTADGDSLTPIIETTKPLGDVAPGGTVATDVRFVITCAGFNHVNANQSVVVSWSGGGTVPEDGAVIGVTTATLAPLTTPWAPDSEGCPSPAPMQEGGVTSRVTLRAPTSPGTHAYTILWDRSFQPATDTDGSALTRLTVVDFTLRVVANAPPTLTVPTSSTVEGNTAGGWTADWSGVSATDAEDTPDPTPSCTPVGGSVLPLGTTSVACSVTDSAGAPDSDAFDVTVVDTTAPVLSGMPADRSVTTGNSSGTAVTFTDPTATDVVDATPEVACTPASGSRFAPGTTMVTCTAMDVSDNASSDTFDVTVTYVPPPSPHAASATWLEPVAGSGGTFVANRGRTIPVKVRLFVGGAERRNGDVGLTLAPCGGGTALGLSLEWSGGRWSRSLDTTNLSASCYIVAATIGEQIAGSFTLDLRGGETAKATRKQTQPHPAAEPRGGKVAKPHRHHGHLRRP